MSIIFNRSTAVGLEVIREKIRFLDDKINTDEKENVEKYMEIFIDMMKRITDTLKIKHTAFFEEIMEKLISYKNDKIRFTSRTRFAIMDYFDSYKD